MSMIDDLTNLYNIRYFKTILKKECQGALDELDKKFCIVLVDIDHFKKINDVFGHRAGDFILRDVADLLKENVRSTDVVARYGGEEMLILLRGATLETGLTFAEKARKAIENRVIKDGDKTHYLTISLGVASFKQRDTEDSIIKRADEGLYKAKNTGRNKTETVETT
jgi:diguanylate cyclase (GGDEF)-like protein